MHCETNKHKRNMMSKKITFSNYCEVCNKSFQCSENYHKKFKCKPIESTEKNQDVNMASLVLQFIQQQQIQQIQFMEQQQNQQSQIMQQQQDQFLQHQQKMMEMIVNKPTVVIDNSTKTINNNVNVFLNEECKDAINWDDFIKNLQLPESVDSKITDIVKFSIINQLKELGMYKRPIHCLNIKTKQLCIKNNDQWEEDSAKNHKLIINSMDNMKKNMFHN